MWWIFDCSPQRGVEPATETVSYGGYVYTSPEQDAPLLAEGEVLFETEGEEKAAEQPYADTYPGYWSVELPASTSFSLRISGNDLYTTRWAGRSPTASGAWFNGALFAVDPAYLDSLLQKVAPDATLPADGGIVVWGSPYDPDHWDCAKVQVQGQRVLCVTVVDDHTLEPVTSGPFDWFFAVDLEPGEVEVNSGLVGKQVYTAEAGEVVSAFWFVGGTP